MYLRGKNSQKMKSIPFDTLKYANKLMSVGFTKEQAEVQAEAIAGLINDNLATKRDLKELEIELKLEFKLLENKLVLKMGAMLATAIAIITALVKLL